MRWLIRTSAPGERQQRLWGDQPFSWSLADALRRLRQEVKVEDHVQWTERCDSDVVLVLRGRQTCRVLPGPQRMLWIISHPELVTREECDGFETIAVASRPFAEFLQQKLGRSVQVLLQCTDTELFRKAGRDGAPRRDIIFVGNSRSVEREGILWAARSGVRLRVYGRGWERWLDRRAIVAERVEPQLLPALYATAKATLNDHWPEMAWWGFINNRIFDALACGLPVVSDYVPGLRELFPDAVLLHANHRQFRRCFEVLMLEYPLVLAGAERAADEIRVRHSFDARARSLLESVKG